MGYTMDDARHDAAAEEWFHEQSLEREKLIQCIYLLVEGDSEEIAFPRLLLRAGLDLEELGVVLVNLQGVANASHVIRTLAITLSADRPVVLVVDNDPEGMKALKYSDLAKHHLLTTVKVPVAPKVECYDGSRGGSLEEAFDLEVVVRAALRTLNNELGVFDVGEILAAVDETKPWLAQISQFVRDRSEGFRGVEKTALAELLADEAPPKTIVDLAQTLLKVRGEHPVLEHTEAVTEGKYRP
jgi:hypothetical protein